MAPIYQKVNDVAIEPYLNEQVTSVQALELAKEPMKAFMLSQVRLKDLETFAKIAGYDKLESPEETPLIVLIPAFVTSELQTAFIIGFMFFYTFFNRRLSCCVCTHGYGYDDALPHDCFLTL